MGDAAAWWEADEVNLVAACLDGSSLGHFAVTCRQVNANLRSRDTLRWLASLRGLDSSAGISSVEHIEIAEVMADLSTSIFFGWGSMEVDEGAHPSLRALISALFTASCTHGPGPLIPCRMRTCTQASWLTFLRDIARFACPSRRIAALRPVSPCPLLGRLASLHNQGPMQCV